MDDEWLVREALVDVLDDAGFSTRQAISAAEALRQLQRDEAVDVVVTDIEMPGMLNGVDLARCARCAAAEIGVLIVFRPPPARAPGRGAFLAKPFVPGPPARAEGSCCFGGSSLRLEALPKPQASCQPWPA